MESKYTEKLNILTTIIKIEESEEPQFLHIFEKRDDTSWVGDYSERLRNQRNRDNYY